MASTDDYFRMGVRLTRQSNIKQHREWYEYIAGDGFLSDLKHNYETKSNQKEMVRVARQVVDTEIYSISKGEGNIGRSFKTDTYNKAIGILVYSDPAVAPSEAGQSPGRFSYAAFFEKPEFLSFIYGVGNSIFHPMKYRPFFQEMAEAIHLAAEELGHRALIKTITKSQPKSGVPEVED